MKKGDKKISFNIRLSDSKNKYLIVGDRDPSRMILPVVIDIKDLEKFISDITEHFTGNQAQVLPLDMDKGVLCFYVKQEEEE